ncbi:MAG: 30S ribosomal protein S3ae [Nitrososphaerales archaeon]
MSTAKKGKKLRDKWRAKEWIVAYSPPYFGSKAIAHIPVTDIEKALGRTIEVTLYDIMEEKDKDPQQYSKKLTFQITSISDGRAETILKAYEYSREYLKSLVRRGSSMINFIKDYTTKDNYTLRVYFIAFTLRRVNSSKKHRIRIIADDILKEKASKMSFEQFIQEIVLGKASSDIFNKAKKIVLLRHADIRKTKLVSKPKLEEVKVQAS